MGVGVSGWPLARAVSRMGQLGVVSGTGLAVVLARRLQSGDPGGHLRRALEQFPFPDITRRIMGRYFIASGKAAGDSFTLSHMPNLRFDPNLTALTVAANFAEVHLAKEGHDGPVGINYLEKIQVATLPSIYGAMLAGVDYVLMGAGIPRLIPGVLDALAEGRDVEYKVDVEQSLPDEHFVSRFSPAEFWGKTPAQLRRPGFYAIVSSATLAMTLARKSNGHVDGFIIEGSVAGGHTAPPRGPLQLTSKGEPLYGPKDLADVEKIRLLGLPFWMAGGFAHPDKLAEALAIGASGIQVGTAFAFCEESGIDPDLKSQVLRELHRAGSAEIFTDPAASPTGYPFKVLQAQNTLSEPQVYENRRRICDLGYLRHPYRRPDGEVGYRCPAEPVEDYVKKGGKLSDTVGRKCVCNALFATIGMGQTRPEGAEAPLITAGNDFESLSRFLKPDRATYRASDVIDYLLSR